jgi:hypothetical protein
VDVANRCLDQWWLSGKFFELEFSDFSKPFPYPNDADSRRRVPGAVPYRAFGLATAVLLVLSFSVQWRNGLPLRLMAAIRRAVEGPKALVLIRNGAPRTALLLSELLCASSMVVYPSFIPGYSIPGRGIQETCHCKRVTRRRSCPHPAGSAVNRLFLNP